MMQPRKQMLNRDHIIGATVGATLSTGAILMPYGAIAAAISWDVTIEGLVALGLVTASALVPFVKRKGKDAVNAGMSWGDPKERLQVKPTEFLERSGLLSMASNVDATVGKLRGLLEAGLRKGTASKWRALMLKCIVAHGKKETVHGRRPLQVLADMREVAEQGSKGDAKAALDRLAEVYAAVGAGCPQTLAFMKEIGKRHSTIETVFLASLDFARTERPLPSGLFAWLKQVDRPLWYALNNLGRTTFHVEGVAAIAHYKAEVAAGRALAAPDLRAAALPLARLASELTAPVGREAA